MLRNILDRLYSGELIAPPSMKWKTISLNEYRRIHRESVENPVEFWSKEARKLTWSKTWVTTVGNNPPNTRWFIDGYLSPYYNVVLKHKESWIWSKPALIWEGEEGSIKVVTYGGLDELVERISSSLISIGLKQGCWVTFYTPPLIESLAAMLACVRLGAPFEPVFTGFGYRELSRRTIRRGSRLIVTVDGYYRRGREIDVLNTVRRAVEYVKNIDVVIVIERIGSRGLRNGEVSFDELVGSTGLKGSHATVRSDHPLFGLHSGYVDDFKPITHGTGGFLTQVYATTRWMGLRPHDTYLCTVWPGWITGVSYVVFGPLMAGSTVVLYDGSLDYPSWGRLWDIIERYAVTLLLTTSGALRAVRSQSPELVKERNIDSLRAVLVTAEPFELELWRWTYYAVGTGHTPVVDSVPSRLTGRIPVIAMYIQSEIGTFITGNLINYTFPPVSPGSVGLPIPGFNVDVVDEEKFREGRLGRLVVKNPWPSMPIEYPNEYVDAWIKGYYDTRDYAFIDEGGYIYVLGRSDPVMKVSGYRISPGAIEKTIEESLGKRALVIGYPDESRFETPVIFIEGDFDENAVRKTIREAVGPIVEPRYVVKINKFKQTGMDELRLILKKSVWINGELDFNVLAQIVSTNDPIERLL